MSDGLPHLAAESDLFPGIVALETINTCNARCPFCPLFQGEFQMDRKHRPAKIMEQSLFEACVREVAGWARKPNTIYLNMNGEPLQDPHFAGRLATVREHGLGSLVDLQTNGQYLSEDLGRAILETGVRRVTLGFDGATPEVYAAHRVRCDYRRVLDNIRRFARLRSAGRYRTRIAVQYVRTLKNQHEVLAAYKLFNAFLDEELDIFQDTLAKDWGDSAAASDLFYLPKIADRTPTGCSMFDEWLIVLSDGVMAACCWDYNLGVSDGGFGNVAEHGMLAVWRGPKRRELAARMRTPSLADKPQKCRTCLAVYGEETIAADDLAKIHGPTVYVSPSGFSYRFSREPAPA